MAVRLALLASLLALLATAPSCDAAGRRVPQGFPGVMWDGDVTTAPVAFQQREWDRMAASGVESVRAAFHWSRAQRAPGVPFDFGETDLVVRLAAERRISLLPVVEYAPRWARAYPSRVTSPPRRPDDYAAYLTALVRRYGPNGTFWTENPTLPRTFVREWQPWNEPHLRTYWNAPRHSRWGHPRGYADLLRASHAAIKAADPGARVVLAGLTQRAWDELAILYRRGLRRYFDVATIQEFPQTAKRSVIAARLFRREMNRHGDRGKPIYATEISWPASKGHTKGIRYQRQETPRGMAGKLRQAFKLLARARKGLRLRRAYWYTWASPYGRGGSIFRYAGLQRYAHGVLTPQPALAAYQKVVRRLEGCAKNERGRCR